MSEAREDVLNKLDALLKKHNTTEPDIPVLTDLVEQARVDLDAIPVLTEEIVPGAAAASDQTPQPTNPIELDLVHEFVREEPVLKPDETQSVLARLEAVEAEVQAEIEARIAQTKVVPNKPASSIEIPQDVHYVPLAPTVPSPPSPTQLAPDTVSQITALIEADVARIIKNSLQQTLSKELPGMLNSALDKTLSSMLEQFTTHLEEVVRSSIADELKKQLAPFKRPTPPPKP